MMPPSNFSHSKKYSFLNVGFNNVNSICNKIHILSDFVVDMELDVLGVAETWLISDVYDSCVALNGYSVVRCDVDGHIRKHGVCLYSKKTIKYSTVDICCRNVC